MLVSRGCRRADAASQGDEVYLKKPVHDESVLPLSLARPGEETPRVMSSASSDRSYTAGTSDGGSCH